MSAPYTVLASRDALVEAWLTTRLRFEPRGWQRDFRAELRDALSRLANGRSALPLTAHYRSPLSDTCDTENILFYNVGTGSFAAAAASGVRFERGYSVPDAPVVLDTEASHYHRYEIGVDGGFQLWRETAKLATFEAVPLPRTSADGKPARIWLALHDAAVEILAGDVRPAVFAVRFALRLPDRSVAPVSLLKPLLDGVISAFGAYDGSQLTEVSERLGASLGRDPSRVAALLVRRERALLGAGQLVVLRANGVQLSDVPITRRLGGAPTSRRSERPGMRPQRP